MSDYASDRHLLVRDRSTLAPGSDKAEYSVHPQNAQSVHSIRRKFRENITTEERHLHSLLAIAPPVHLVNNWEEGGNASLAETLGNDLLVTRASMQSVPTLGFDLRTRLR